MKTPKNTLVPALGLIIVLGLVGAQADLVTSTNSGNWSADAIWSGGSGPLSRPVNGDTVNIQSGDTVVNDFGGGFLDGTYDISVSGGLNDAGVFRVNGSTLSVGSTGSLGGGGFWDHQNGTLSFESGSSVNMGTWEQKDQNIYNFKLSASGFITLTPGTFAIGNHAGPGSGNISNATYNVDMALYTGGTGIITLADFGSDGYGMDNATFQGAGGLNVNNAGGYTANLQWNDTDEAIELNITAAIPEPSVLGLFGVAIGLLTVVRRRIRLLYTGN